MSHERIRDLTTDYNELVDTYNNYNNKQKEYKIKYYKSIEDYNSMVACGQKNLIEKEYIEQIELPFTKIKMFQFSLTELLEHYYHLIKAYNYNLKYYNYREKFYEVIFKSNGKLRGKY